MRLPASLGRYRLDSVLGSGTFATVYRGRDEALDITVAVKVLADNWSFDPETRSRFIGEAQLLRRVDGTRVVRVHDIGQTDDACPFFVMDFADRGTIESRIGELAAMGRGLSVEDVLRFSRQLAEGIAEVHRLGVVHRDLKPSNLLLRTTGRVGAAPAPGQDQVAADIGTALVRLDERLVVGDLGLARDLDGPTRLTAAVGTPGYMAPEQADPSSPIDRRADIFAATAILHTVVAGAPPPESAASLPDDPSLPRPVADLLRRGLAPRPADRFGSVEEWLTAVEGALDSIGDDWQTPSVRVAFIDGLSTLTRSTPRARRSVPAPAAGLAHPAGPSPVPSPHTTRRKRGVLVLAGVILVAVVAAVAALGILSGRGGGEGGGPASSSGTMAGVDPTLGTEARLIDPIDVTAATDGTAFVVETSTNRVRRLGTDGILATVAGTGSLGYSGDGGPATAASLSYPTGAAAAADGSVYVADNGNRRVRKIAPDGTINTVAGNGSSGSAVAGTDARSAGLLPTDVEVLTDGRLLIAESLSHRVWVVEGGKLQPFAGSGAAGSDGDGSAAVDATLQSPSAVAAAADGSVYVLDDAAAVVRRVDADGTITTVAGTGTAGFSGDGGPATQAQLDSPQGISAAPDGTVYIGDVRNRRVRRVGTDGIMSTVAGTGTRGYTGDGGPATAAELATPQALAIGPGGAVLVVDGFNNRLRSIDAGGTITTAAGTGPAGMSGDGGPATEAPLRTPRGIGFDEEGRLYIVEGYTDGVRRVERDGTISTLGYQPDSGLAGLVVGPGGILVESATLTSQVLFVATDGRVMVLAGTRGGSGFSGDGGPGSAAQLNFPVGVAIDGQSVLVADSANHRLRRIDQNGVITTVAGTGLPQNDGGRDAPAAEVALAQPTGVAVGPDASIYVTEMAGNRVRRIRPDGIMVTIAGTGQAGFGGDGGPATAARLNAPGGVAVAADGTVYVTEVKGHRVRRIGTDGTITTVAGTGDEGFSGDGGPAIVAQLSGPAFCAIGPDASLYVSDSGNGRVRRVDQDGTITTVAGAF